MVRKTPARFRRPGPTETELKLKAEIDRLRRRLDEMRKRVPTDKYGSLYGDRLEGAALGDFYAKLGNWARNLLHDWVPPSERCELCGGMGPEQQDAVFAKKVRELREGDPRYKPR